MKKILFLLILLFAGFCCYAQGTIAGDFSIYPDEEFKDSFMLCGRTLSIQDSSFCFYDSYDVINTSNSEEEKAFVFQYNLDVYGSIPDAERIHVFINSDEIKCSRTDNQEYSIGKFYYKCKIPTGHFKLSYIIHDSGHEIGGTANGCINYIEKSKWNVSNRYAENVYISITNDYVTLSDNTFTVLGKGKKDGKTFFLKSGCVYLNHTMFDISCQNFNSGYGGGSGCPTLPSIYHDDDKIHSATEYIYEFITAARIVERKLDGDWEYLDNSYNDLLNLLNNTLSKDELRVLRNAFYAKNGYIFKDENLNNYFSSALCYWPDKSVTISNIKMKESEKILIEMIQAAENGQSPEAVFKKYKK